MKVKVTNLYWFIGEIEVIGEDEKGKSLRWTGKPEEVGLTMRQAREYRDSKTVIELEEVNA